MQEVGGSNPPGSTIFSLIFLSRDNALRACLRWRALTARRPVGRLVASSMWIAGNFNADTFIFEDNFGIDVIQDFDVSNQFERIDLSGVTNITDFQDLVTNHLSQQGNNTTITLDNNNIITLLDVNASTLGTSDFIF